MDEQSFEEVQRRLAEQFLQETSTLQTDEEVGAALLDFVLQRERLRHRVEGLGPEREKVDRQTLEHLYHQTELGPEHFFAESIFKRLAKDPANAMHHYRLALNHRSTTQAERAKSPRPRRYDSITKLINDIVVDDPAISTEAVREELAAIDGIVIADGEIRNTQDATTMRLKNLPSRVSDARKRLSG